MESCRQSGGNSLRQTKSVRENLERTRLPVTSRIPVLIRSQEDNDKLEKETREERELVAF